MQRILLKSKIHGIVVTYKNLNYEGSIEIDGDILKQADICEGELVQVVNLNTGERFDTYTLKGEPGSRICALNGGAARKGEIGDPLLVMSYCIINLSELPAHKPVILIMSKENEIKTKNSG